MKSSNAPVKKNERRKRAAQRLLDSLKEEGISVDRIAAIKAELSKIEKYILTDEAAIQRRTKKYRGDKMRFHK